MSARIFVHPRCIPYAPAQGALLASLGRVGITADTHMIGPASKKGFHEMVRLICGDVHGFATYERCDGTRFTYNATPRPEPTEAA